MYYTGKKSAIGQTVAVSVVILFDWFSKTKAKVLKRSTTREYVLCVYMLDREGRTLGVLVLL